jgi:hypothetical protein
MSLLLASVWAVRMTSVLLSGRYSFINVFTVPGADPGFQVRGGALKNNCAMQREVRKNLGYFVWGAHNISVISWWSVLLVEEIGVPGENHQPVASH